MENNSTISHDEEKDVISIHDDDHEEDSHGNAHQSKRQKTKTNNGNENESNANQATLFQSILNNFPTNSITRDLLLSGLNNTETSTASARPMHENSNINDLSKIDEVHATASKILLLITATSPHPTNLSHVTLPFGEVENLAAELVQDRRESILVSVAQLKKSYDETLKQTKEEHKKQQSKITRENQEEMNQLKEKLKENLVERDLYWKGEMDKLLKEHERVMCEFRKGFQDDVQGMRDEMKEMKERHERTLEEYRMASSKALEVIRKKVLGDA